MDPLMHSLNSTLSLTNEERDVFILPESVPTSTKTSSVHVLLARVLTTTPVYKPRFYDQMSGLWKGRFPVTISDYNGEIFHVSFACAGDKIRVLRKEPWHFQNNLIVLHTPDALKNASVEDLVFTPFWVQIYRLPFLSKSAMLAEALGNLIGEFLEVFDDSTNEGWGPFLRIRVKLCVTKPLPIGRMIKLPNIRDEFWIDFRYERLPVFCFECGRLGHPFEQCVSFMERMDNGNDDDLPFGPWMKGTSLPTDNYDRYRTDFSKGNAWPLLTRLARNTITASIPGSYARPQPQPRHLFAGESSSTPVIHNSSITENIISSVSTLSVDVHKDMLMTNSSSPQHSLTTHHNPAHASPKLKGILTTPTTTIPSPSPNPQTTAPPKNKLLPPPAPVILPTSSHDVSDLSHIFTPDVGHSSIHPFATYPPSTTLLHPPINSLKKISIQSHGHQIFTPATPTVHITPTIGKENIGPNSVYKRPNDSLSLRKTLKRCRGNAPTTPSLSSIEQETFDGGQVFISKYRILFPRKMYEV
ncbi:hypothetical protein F8388_016415 [Cannabis sativa]|uniref:CCHC-type domain-containing protein n=1 Tax=Cannabis sativa TaxID=3483 RepID=A0A7J6ETN9_CANSA|nr:hypothetical protein G4B88_015941 [Cannabis sativa]KAF4386163.1 hypothetical protein F8388_016415 [Cannabis sativa]